jgi:hypothetical protein
MRRISIVIGALAASACGSSGGGHTGQVDAAAGSIDGSIAGSIDAPAGVEDLDMKATDFECVLRWTMVGGYRITNKLGHDPLPVANNPSGGGAFPVGTIIQIVPTEAMVKRRTGFDATTHDWEFFALAVSASGTTINKRGTSDVVNAFGGNCLTCHAKAMPAFDMVCGTTHGCDPLPLSEAQLISLQNSDARCP